MWSPELDALVKREQYHDYLRRAAEDRRRALLRAGPGPRTTWSWVPQSRVAQVVVRGLGPALFRFGLACLQTGRSVDGSHTPVLARAVPCPPSGARSVGSCSSGGRATCFQP